jgi:hypothetical protein
MATLLDNGELVLSEEECDKLKLPADSVIPASSADEIKQRLQEIEDEEVRKLFRTLGPSADEEPYEGTLPARPCPAARPRRYLPRRMHTPLQATSSAMSRRRCTIGNLFRQQQPPPPPHPRPRPRARRPGSCILGTAQAIGRTSSGLASTRARWELPR